MEVYLRNLQLEGDVTRYASAFRAAGYSKPTELMAADPSMQDILGWGVDNFEDIKKIYFALHPEDAAYLEAADDPAPAASNPLEATYGLGGDFDEEMPEDPYEAYELMKQQLADLQTKKSGGGGGTGASGDEYEELQRLKREYENLLSGGGAAAASPSPAAGQNDEDSEYNDLYAQLQALRGGGGSVAAVEEEPEPSDEYSAAQAEYNMMKAQLDALKSGGGAGVEAEEDEYESTKAMLEKMKLQIMSGEVGEDDLDDVLDQVFNKYGDSGAAPAATNARPVSAVGGARGTAAAPAGNRTAAGAGAGAARPAVGGARVGGNRVGGTAGVTGTSAPANSNVGRARVGAGVSSQPTGGVRRGTAEAKGGPPVPTGFKQASPSQNTNQPGMRTSSPAANPTPQRPGNAPTRSASSQALGGNGATGTTRTAPATSSPTTPSGRPTLAGATGVGTSPTVGTARTTQTTPRSMTTTTSTTPRSAAGTPTNAPNSARGTGAAPNSARGTPTSGTTSTAPKPASITASTGPVIGAGLEGVKRVEMSQQTKTQLEALRALAEKGVPTFGNDIKIEVSDPVQVGKGNQERTMYLVTLTTNMKQFSHLTFNYLQVRRSYHHFEELFKKLQSSCNYNLPKFPKKDVLGRFSKQTINERMTYFQMLMDHLARDPGLNQLSCVVEFFDDSKFADIFGGKPKKQ